MADLHPVASAYTHLSTCSPLVAQHPSPLSASRGFIGNNHFKQCNEWLEKKYGRKTAVLLGDVFFLKRAS